MNHWPFLATCVVSRLLVTEYQQTNTLITLLWAKYFIQFQPNSELCFCKRLQHRQGVNNFRGVKHKREWTFHYHSSKIPPISACSRRHKCTTSRKLWGEACNRQLPKQATPVVCGNFNNVTWYRTLYGISWPTRSNVWGTTQQLTRNHAVVAREADSSYEINSWPATILQQY